jgi:hypothetical protein
VNKIDATTKKIVDKIDEKTSIVDKKIQQITGTDIAKEEAISGLKTTKKQPLVDEALAINNEMVGAINSIKDKAINATALGIKANDEASNEIYEFDPSNSEWTLLKPEGPEFPPL